MKEEQQTSRPVAMWGKFVGVMCATFVMVNWFQAEVKNDVKDNYLTGDRNSQQIEALKEKYHDLDKRLDGNKKDHLHDMKEKQWQIDQLKQQKK